MLDNPSTLKSLKLIYFSSITKVFSSIILSVKFNVKFFSFKNKIIIEEAAIAFVFLITLILFILFELNISKNFLTLSEYFSKSPILNKKLNCKLYILHLVCRLLLEKNEGN